jgi:hypothetical protein
MGIFNGFSKTLRAARGNRRYYEYTRKELNEMNRNKRATLKAAAAPIVQGKIQKHLQGHPESQRLYNESLGYQNYTPEEINQMIFVRHAKVVNNENDRARAEMSALNTGNEGNNTYQAKVMNLQKAMNDRHRRLEEHRAAYQKGVRNGGSRRTRRTRRTRSR